jgi:hypothetical protein
MNKKNSTITYNIYHHPAACTTTTIIGRPQNKNTSKNGGHGALSLALSTFTSLCFKNTYTSERKVKKKQK